MLFRSPLFLFLFLPSKYNVKELDLITSASDFDGLLYSRTTIKAILRVILFSYQVIWIPFFFLRKKPYGFFCIEKLILLFNLEFLISLIYFYY